MSSEEEKNNIENRTIEIELDNEGNLYYITHNEIFDSNFVQIYNSTENINYCIFISGVVDLIFMCIGDGDCGSGDNSRVIEYNRNTKTEIKISDCFEWTILYLHNKHIYVNISDYIVKYNVNTKMISVIDSEKRLSHNNLFFSGDSFFYFCKNNIFYFDQSLFFCVEEEKFTYSSILDVFIKEEVMKIVFNNGKLYTYIFRKLISIDNVGKKYNNG